MERPDLGIAQKRRLEALVLKQQMQIEFNFLGPRYQTKHGHLCWLDFAPYNVINSFFIFFSIFMLAPDLKCGKIIV